MPQVDTSIYRTSAPANPLATVGSAASTINALNQNKLFGQTFGARQAIGDAYQNSIDPTTGQLDTNKLLANVAHDPRAAFMAGDVAQQALARQQAQLNIKTQQLNLGLTHAKAMSGFFGQLAANPNLSMKDITSAATEMVSEGLISPQEAAAEFPNVPSDSAGMKAWALQHYQRYMAMQGQLQAALPKPQVVNAGGQQVVIDTNALTNPNITGTRIINSLSPGEAAAPTQVMVRNPDGTFTPSTVTRAQFAGMAGQGPVATGVPLTKAGLPPEVATAPVGTFQNGQPGVVSREQFAEGAGTTPPAGNGPVPLAFKAAAGQQPPAQAAPASTTPGFMPTGPKLGQASAADVQAHESAQQGVDLQRAADTVPAQKAILGNLESDLNQFTAGPGADWTKVAKAWANRNLPLPPGMQFDPKSIASQDEFAKQAFQLAQQQFQTLGGTGTDTKLDSTMHTSPNEFLSDLGNRGIIALLKGNADAVAVKNREWQAWMQGGHGPETYGQFSTQFNKEFDPRVFQMVYLSPADRQAMVKGMSKNELAQFRADVNLAVRDGWIPNPQAPNAGQ